MTALAEEMTAYSNHGLAVIHPIHSQNVAFNRGTLRELVGDWTKRVASLHLRLDRTSSTSVLECPTIVPSLDLRMLPALDMKGNDLRSK